MCNVWIALPPDGQLYYEASDTENPYHLQDMALLNTGIILQKPI